VNVLHGNAASDSFGKIKGDDNELLARVSIRWTFFFAQRHYSTYLASMNFKSVSKLIKAALLLSNELFRQVIHQIIESAASVRQIGKRYN